MTGRAVAGIIRRSACNSASPQGAQNGGGHGSGDDRDRGHGFRAFADNGQRGSNETELTAILFRQRLQAPGLGRGRMPKSRIGAAGARGRLSLSGTEWPRSRSCPRRPWPRRLPPATAPLRRRCPVPRRTTPRVHWLGFPASRCGSAPRRPVRSPPTIHPPHAGSWSARPSPGARAGAGPPFSRIRSSSTPRVTMGGILSMPQRQRAARAARSLAWEAAASTGSRRTRRGTAHRYACRYATA